MKKEHRVCLVRNWSGYILIFYSSPGAQTDSRGRRGWPGRQGTENIQIRFLFIVDWFERTSKCSKEHISMMQLIAFALSSMKTTFSHNSFICVKSLTVVPHKEAVFSTRTTLPLYFSILTTWPSRVLALMSWNAISMSSLDAGRPVTVHRGGRRRDLDPLWSKSPESDVAARNKVELCLRRGEISWTPWKCSDFILVIYSTQMFSDVT